MGHLQRLASLDEHAILGGHPSAHHDRRGRGQPQGTGAGNAQHCDGRLERKPEDDLCLGDALVGLLQRGEAGSESTEDLHSMLITKEHFGGERGRSGYAVLGFRTHHHIPHFFSGPVHFTALQA